ncbi:hypothetical protein DPMN_002949 [Dreissena polymorpha]|uniref:Uncharacterized protein n=1 Tax=Dreissena polymorpha TaxID=45954 RepID=A0A9D4ML02_DREPO|nr:hypothetical protein DPMN_002949 [Dreissena polymorpha]
MARQRPTRVPHVEIDRIVIKKVQYQFEVNRCSNEEIIVKGNFGWAWPMWAGRPRVGNGPCIVEINCIVIREVQYQFEVNLCRNEEIIVKGSFGWTWPMWAWPMWAERPRIDRIVIREVHAVNGVQAAKQLNRCRNEEIIVKGNFGWVWPMLAGRPRIEVQYQFEDNQCRNEENIVK